MRNKIEQQDFRSVHRWSKCDVILNENSYIDHAAILRYLNSTYVIEKPFSFTSIINDMKRVFKSKKPSLGTIHGLGPATSTSTTTGPTDLMLSIPACDSESDESTSAQVAAGVNVTVQLHPPHLYVLTYCYQADRS